jgi:hypothetical protein
MNEELNTEETPEVTNKQHPVFQVTTVSKYLALLLFVLLPFIGGYVGYEYAPERMVEKYILSGEKETDSSTSIYEVLNKIITADVSKKFEISLVDEIDVPELISGVQSYRASTSVGLKLSATTTVNGVDASNLPNSEISEYIDLIKTLLGDGYSEVDFYDGKPTSHGALLLKGELLVSFRANNIMRPAMPGEVADFFGNTNEAFAYQIVLTKLK